MHITHIYSIVKSNPVLQIRSLSSWKMKTAIAFFFCLLKVSGFLSLNFFFLLIKHISPLSVHHSHSLDFLLSFYFVVLAICNNSRCSSSRFLRTATISAVPISVVYSFRTIIWPKLSATWWHTNFWDTIHVWLHRWSVWLNQ